MEGQPQSAFPSTLDIQTLQPRLRLYGPAVLLIVSATFPLFFLLERGPSRVLHCGLSILALCAVLYHFSKEYRLVHDRLTAVGVVTEYCTSWKGRSRFVQFIMRKFSPEVPIIEYSFVAFDQRTHIGKTGGWWVRGLYKGAEIVVLYKPGSPKLNRPLKSFIFYSFG